MLKSGSSELDPGTHEFLVPLVRQKHVVLAIRFRRMIDFDRLQFGEFWNPPRLGAVGDIAIREKDHRDHELDRDSHRFHSHVKTISRALSSDNWEWRFAIPSEHGQQEVGLFGFRREAGARPASLHIDNHHWQFGDHSQAHRLTFKADTRAGAGRDREFAGERGSDGCGHGGDFVLCLKGSHAKVFVRSQFVQNVARRCDRIAGVKEPLSGQLCGSHKAQCRRFISRQLAIPTGWQFRRRHFVVDGEGLGRESIVVPAAKSSQVGFHDLRLLAELVLHPVFGGSRISFVEPINQAECEEVLAAISLADSQSETIDRVPGQASHRNFVNSECLERNIAFCKRIRQILRLCEVAFVELVLINDERATSLEVLNIRLQSGGVHRDKGVDRVARREDVVIREAQLVTGNSGQRSGGSSNLRREVGQRTDVVSERGGNIRHLRSNKLHAVAAVATETDDNSFECFFASALSFRFRRIDRGGH